jgi:hypothetical protein
MIPFEIAPILLLSSALFLVLCSSLVLTWGRRFPRGGDWVVGIGLFIFLAAQLFAGNALFDNALKTKTWTRGWILPPDMPGAITVGVIQDTLGLSTCLFLTLVAVMLLLHKGTLRGVSRPERFYAAVGFGAAGACISWFSLTPWISFIGLGLAILGGFLSFGMAWEKPEEASNAATFAWERSIGVILAIFGACGLNLGEPTLTIISGFLIVGGLFIQFQPFPFLHGVVCPSRLRPWIRVLMTQILPAWSAFSILLRLEPQLRQLGVFPVAGWVAGGATFLVLIVGICQADWRRGLAGWVSGGLSLAATVLAFAGPRAGFSMLLGLTAGGMTFVSAGSALLETSQDSKPQGDSSVPLKALVIFGIAAATGFFGFVSMDGGLAWIGQAMADKPAMVAVPVVLISIFVFLGWKLAWSLISLPGPVRVEWPEFVCPIVTLLLSFGVFWTGMLTGGAVPGGGDQVFASLFGYFFEPINGAPALDPTTEGVYGTMIAVAIAVAYWLAKKLETPPASAVWSFISSGYGIEKVGQKLELGLDWVGRQMNRWVDNELWNRWLPLGLATALTFVARQISRADRAISDRTRDGARVSAEVPAKFLQLIQNGDVQWYLVFALGSGLLILARYLFLAGSAGFSGFGLGG